MQWSRLLSAGSASSAGKISIDSSANVYITAYYYSGGSRSNIPIIAKYNTSGTLQWQRSFDSALDDKDFIIGVTSGGIINVLGTSDGVTNGLILKLPTDGSKTGNYTLNGNVYTYAASSWTVISPGLASSIVSPSYTGAHTVETANLNLTFSSKGFSITKQTI